MDFNDTQEEAAFRAQVRAWLAENAPKYLVKSQGGYGEIEGENLERAKAWQAAKARAGYGAIQWPKEFGGMGGTPIQGVIFGQEEEEYDSHGEVFTIGLGMCMPTIMVHGTQAHKDRYIKKAMHAEEIWCQLFSEPVAGSDLAGIRTRAERDGDDWIVNGQKVWTSGAHYSDFGILVVRTDPNVPKHKGLTYFIVDMRAKGVEVRPIKQITGGSGFNEVFFSDVRIPDSNRMGAIGNGWNVAMTTLMNERFSIAGMKSTFADAGTLLALARRVELENGPAIADASVRERIADWYVKSRGLELTHFRTLTTLSKGEAPGPENSIGKFVKGRSMQDLAAFGTELMDMAGSLTEETVAGLDPFFMQSFLQLPGLRIAGGTDEILRNVVAERVLGLPGEPRVDKDIAFKDLPRGK